MDAPMNPERTSKGPLVAIIIIILILVLGSIYVMSKNKTESTMTEDGTATTTTTGTTAAPSQSTDISSIEADAKALNTTSLDSGFSDVEAELNTN